MEQLNHYVAVTLTGSVITASGTSVSDALGTPMGLDYYLEANQKLICDQVWLGGRKHDLTAFYVKDNGTFIVAHCQPLSAKYEHICGIRHTSYDDMVEAIKLVNKG